MHGKQGHCGNAQKRPREKRRCMCPDVEGQRQGSSALRRDQSGAREICSVWVRNKHPSCFSSQPERRRKETDHSLYKPSSSILIRCILQWVDFKLEDVRRNTRQVLKNEVGRERLKFVEIHVRAGDKICKKKKGRENSKGFSRRMHLAYQGRTYAG